MMPGLEGWEAFPRPGFFIDWRSPRELFHFAARLLFFT
jgi:hypothetical protein